MNDPDLNIDALHRMWASFEYGEPGFFSYVGKTLRGRGGCTPAPRGDAWQGAFCLQADAISGEIQS